MLRLGPGLGLGLGLGPGLGLGLLDLLCPPSAPRRGTSAQPERSWSSRHKARHP